MAERTTGGERFRSLPEAEWDADCIAEWVEAVYPPREDVRCVVQQLADRNIKQTLADASLDLKTANERFESCERDLYLRLGEAEDQYAEVAHALGVEHAADGVASEPGPLEEVLREIRKLHAAQAELIEIRLRAEAQAEPLSYQRVYETAFAILRDDSPEAGKTPSMRACAIALALTKPATPGTTIYSYRPTGERFVVGVMEPQPATEQDEAAQAAVRSVLSAMREESSTGRHWADKIEEALNA